MFRDASVMARLERILTRKMLQRGSHLQNAAAWIREQVQADQVMIFRHTEKGLTVIGGSPKTKKDQRRLIRELNRRFRHEAPSVRRRILACGVFRLDDGHKLIEPPYGLISMEPIVALDESEKGLLILAWRRVHEISRTEECLIHAAVSLLGACASRGSLQVRGKNNGKPGAEFRMWGRTDGELLTSKLVSEMAGITPQALSLNAKYREGRMRFTQSGYRGYVYRWPNVGELIINTIMRAKIRGDETPEV